MKPRISINLAVSVDAKISDVHGRASGWTSPLDGKRLVSLRHGADALLVGRKTWLADRMTLAVPGAHPPPLRCIVSRHGDLPDDHPIFQSPGGAIHVLCTESLPTAESSSGVRFHLGTIEAFLEMLGSEHQVRHLHCEGGGWLVRELAEIHAVDTLYLTVAGHTLFGGETASTATGLPSRFLGVSMQMELVEFAPSPETGECFLTYGKAKNQ